MKHPYLPLLPLLLFFCAATPAAKGQADSLLYGVQPVRVAAEEQGELRTEVGVMPFMLDNEYDSGLTDGYTLPGVWLRPIVSYQPLANLRIEAGAHLLHFWGAERYPNVNYSQLASMGERETQRGFHAVPVVRAQVQLTPTLSLVLGTIHGQAQHRLIEPFYNKELNLMGDPEAGVQMRWDGRPLWLDAWVNWQTFIFKNDRRQEAFVFGLSARLKPSRADAGWQWYVPLQALFQHHGGEINTAAEDREVKTWLNAAAGVGVDIPLRAKFPASLNAEVEACYFGQRKGSALPFDNGYGLYARLTARLWRTRVGVGYWQCKDFVSIMGSPLYGAMSVSEEGTVYRKPRMLTAHAEYTQPLGRGFAWGLEADAYAHLKADKLTPGSAAVREGGGVSFSAGIYLRACPSFLIHKFGKKHGGE